MYSIIIFLAGRPGWGSITPSLSLSAWAHKGIFSKHTEAHNIEQDRKVLRLLGHTLIIQAGEQEFLNIQELKNTSHGGLVDLFANLIDLLPVT